MLQCGGNARLDGVHHVLQDILELGGVLLDLVEGTGVCWLRGIGRLYPCVWVWLVHVGELRALLLTEHAARRGWLAASVVALILLSWSKVAPSHFKRKATGSRDAPTI